MIQFVVGVLHYLITLLFFFFILFFATMNDKNLYILIFYGISLNLFVIIIKNYSFSRYGTLKYSDLIYLKRTTLKELYKVGHIWPLIISRSIFHFSYIVSFYFYFSRKTGSFDMNEFLLFFELGFKLIVKSILN